MKTKLLKKIRRKYQIGRADFIFYENNKENINPCSITPIINETDIYYFYKKKNEKKYNIEKNIKGFIYSVLDYSFGKEVL